MTSPDGKVHGANMGPIWGRQDPGGPHVGPMNIAIWDPLMAPWHGNTFRITGPFLLWPGETNASKAIQTLTAVLTRTKTSTRTITNHRNAINAFLKVPACYDFNSPPSAAYMRGWGLLNQLLRSVIFAILQNDQNTGYQYTITFIFDRCHRTLAAETPVKYERDLKWLICIFAESKFLVTKKLTKGVSGNPHPWSSSFNLLKRYKLPNYGGHVLVVKALDVNNW